MLGLATPFITDNFGTKLQAFALQNFLKKEGAENEIICYRFGEKIADPRKLFIRNRRTFKKEQHGKEELKKRDRQYREGMLKRYDRFKSFEKEHLCFSDTCTMLKDVSELASGRYETVICGSDQIWLPSHALEKYYLLGFLPSDVRKVAYAPSFGVSSIPWYIRGDYAKALKDFSLLTARETDGSRLIRELSGREGRVVSDPTFLLKGAEWEKLLGLRKEPANRKYVLGYILGGSEEHRVIARKYADGIGASLILIPGGDAGSELDEKYSDICLYDIGPREFVELIKTADTVFTDSFHGTVFSILFEKNVWCFERYRNNSGDSRNSRIHTLLDTAGIRDRLLTGGREDFGEVINYTSVNERIEQLRNTSAETLLEAI